ncbi:MAG TPA: fused response regulator/phosphatase [Thermoanaerobaculia bacterium]|jgi:serine phosphatase RsbU (regulator of sigma subunit)|nr:fused response regulator/phosphatase [Thermoanaerobaculia bacterium]
MDKRQRIVIIDDNANDLEVTRRFLERRGYDAVPAQSGEEGLRLAEQLVPDAIVVDYRMPGMDGFEVTRRIKADPQLQTIPVLMLTGSDSAEHVVQGLGAGAEDFVTKGADVEVMVARLRALLRMKAYQDQLRRMNQQMTRDLQIARRVQEALMPPTEFVAKGIEIRSAYIPSEVLSGDFYDYFVQKDSLYLFVADVSGHGLPAAILVSLLKSYIHSEAATERSLAEFMTHLNDFLYGVSLPTQFATAALFRMEAGNQLVYANAAHPPFLVHHRDRGRTVVYEQPSNLLGAMPNMLFEEHTISVSPGDTLFVYTDGVTDRMNADRELYTVDRVAAVLERVGNADLPAVYDAIYADVSSFAATEEFKDDIAFVVARFH